MSHEYLQKRRVVAATADDMSGTGVSLVYNTPVPIDVYRVGYILSTALDAGSFAFEVNINAVGDTDAASFTGSTTTDQSAVGTVLAWQLSTLPAQTSGDDTLTGGTTPQTSLLNTAPEGPVRVKAGQQVEIEITTGATSGSGYAFIEFVEFDSPFGLNVVDSDHVNLVDAGDVTFA